MSTVIPESLQGVQRRSVVVEEVIPDKRELLLRAAPYEIESDIGSGIRETFARGCFAKAVKDPSRISIRLEHEGPLVGRGLEADDRSDGLWVRAKIASTGNGNDALTLVGEDILREASVEFVTDPSMVVQRRGSTIHVRHKRVQLLGVALVPHGAHDGTSVELVRSAEAAVKLNDARLWLQCYRELDPFRT